jgi:hypothetical protein
VLKYKDADGIQKQRSKDDMGDGAEHPFVRDAIEQSLARRKATLNENAVVAEAEAVSSSPSAIARPAAVESSCESVGSKGKHHAAVIELPEEVLSFEQRRKDILRLTREAEERKKRFV